MDIQMCIINCLYVSICMGSLAAIEHRGMHAHLHGLTARKPTGGVFRLCVAKEKEKTIRHEEEEKRDKETGRLDHLAGRHTRLEGRERAPQASQQIKAKVASVNLLFDLVCRRYVVSSSQISILRLRQTVPVCLAIG